MLGKAVQGGMNSALDLSWVVETLNVAAHSHNLAKSSLPPPPDNQWSQISANGKNCRRGEKVVLPVGLTVEARRPRGKIRIRSSQDIEYSRNQHAQGSKSRGKLRFHHRLLTSLAPLIRCFDLISHDNVLMERKEDTVG